MATALGEGTEELGEVGDEGTNDGGGGCCGEGSSRLSTGMAAGEAADPGGPIVELDFLITKLGDIRSTLTTGVLSGCAFLEAAAAEEVLASDLQCPAPLL